ncbi:type II secretion system F family protein [Zoogloea sp.]|uniref:type II secretion system F family protein n=1 Tax=Zoogloea sp. TaxID=49181 RepID=UPI0035AE5A0B
MTTYAYRALDPLGRLVRGRLDALNPAELEQRLQRRQLELIHARPALRWPGADRPPRRELINFCFHLEQFLQAGVPILESLDDLHDATDHPAFRATIAAVRRAVEGGDSLSRALENHPHAFDAVFCSLVRAGERAGELPTVLRAISASLKRDDELAAFTRRIAIYPAIVLAIVLLAVGVALIHVVPELAKLFQTAGQPLPLQTRALIGLSGLLRQHGAVLAGIALIGALGLRHAIATRPAVRYRRDAWLLRTPILGEVRRKLILARFTSLFALMYGAGITIVDALRVAADTLGNLPMERALALAAHRIEHGHSLSDAFGSSTLFPPLVARMLRIGETTGALDDALTNVSYFYERDVREAIARLQASIEPALTVILGLLLLAVMSAVMLPIYDIVTQLKL